MANSDPFGARGTLQTAEGPLTIYRLDSLERAGLARLDRLPFSIRVLLEDQLRHCRAGRDGIATPEDVRALAAWRPDGLVPSDIPFMPARVVLQDFTGVPAIVDLAAMRSAMHRMGGDPQRINPLIPADLVIDHSVQVDLFGSPQAFAANVQLEYERNGERYALLRWAQSAFRNYTVVPPGTGIVHQVNLEYLSQVVQRRRQGDEVLAFPDTLVGTDSHTTMVNGMGVLGWGVGGIEAEAVLLGQPYAMLTPEVIGFRLSGELPEGATATDLVLTVVQMLRRRGVVDKFVEFYGSGLSRLPVPDRATIGNMAPEYGATCGFFPVDEQTLAYLRGTGRAEATVDAVERYCKEQGLFRGDDTPEPEYTDRLELDMGDVEPSMAGPRRPQDRLALAEVGRSFWAAFPRRDGEEPDGGAAGGVGAGRGGVGVAVRPATEIEDGAVAIAAITSCTNTSNPSVMVAAGLLAKRAVERGLSPRPWVKTSMAPGSRVVSDYLEGAGLLPYLARLGFDVVGYGCTTCIGNSGELIPEVAAQVRERDLAVAAVLSGNRNFEGRINALVKANYLASPPLVVAYALAGRIDVDLTHEPLGVDAAGAPVHLREIWPSQAEVRSVVESALRPELFRREYGHVFEGDERWRSLPTPESELYAWDPASTYVREPPFFQDMPPAAPALADVHAARVLAVLGDSITTDHISPAGSIARDGPAGRYLVEHGVEPRAFNTYGARRGNHEVMMRGTFANVRLRNRLAPGTEGGWTTLLPEGEVMSIFDAAERYQAQGTPLVVLAGKEYGSGSSRDWAAKGPLLLGIRAVIAESYERIHRSNLIGMGVLPLQFPAGDSAASLGLDGSEVFDLEGIDRLQPGSEVRVRARRAGGADVSFVAVARINSAVELEYYRHGGILPYVLRRLLGEGGPR